MVVRWCGHVKLWLERWAVPEVAVYNCTGAMISIVHTEWSKNT